MTGALVLKCEEARQSGSKNFIVDLQHCEECAPECINGFIRLHQECYGQGESIVFTGVNANVLAAFKKAEDGLVPNVAPRMDEAIDIISMEILERELLSEE